MSSLVYPLTLKSKGLETTDSPVKVIGDAILSALLTEQLERPYRPDYGFDTDIFQTVSSRGELLANCRQAINYGLEAYGQVEYELRVSVDGNGDYSIIVVYQVGNTTSRVIFNPNV